MSEIREEVPVPDDLPLRQERRRAGRMANVHPALIPLLRGKGHQPCDDEALREGDLAPATGIAVAVVISGLIWFIIACAIYVG